MGGNLLKMEKKRHNRSTVRLIASTQIPFVCLYGAA